MTLRDDHVRMRHALDAARKAVSSTDSWIREDGRWQTFSLAEQLANVGSEVERAIAAWRSGRTERFEKALDRALELFDLTARDERWRGHRCREILRAREEFVRLFLGDPPEPASVESLRRYFLAFAVLARR